jgi:hypothetical protein
MKDPVAEKAFRQYKEWRKVNTAPVLSATHGNRYVFTYLNKTAESSGLQGRFPFPEGAVLAKESFEAQEGKPGAKGPLFIMEKRGKGYDRDHADWHYAVVEATGVVSMKGSGHDRSPTQFCAACHAMAKANDYVFGTGTTMKVKPTAMGPRRAILVGRRGRTPAERNTDGASPPLPRQAARRSQPTVAVSAAPRPAIAPRMPP